MNIRVRARRGEKVAGESISTPGDLGVAVDWASATAVGVLIGTGVCVVTTNGDVRTVSVAVVVTPAKGEAT